MSKALKARQLPSRDLWEDSSSSEHSPSRTSHTLSFLCTHHLDMMLHMNSLLIEERVTWLLIHRQESYAAALEPLNDMNGRWSLVISLRTLIIEKTKNPSVLHLGNWRLLVVEDCDVETYKSNKIISISKVVNIWKVVSAKDLILHTKISDSV